jgi:hypothetical protein
MRGRLQLAAEPWAFNRPNFFDRLIDFPALAIN